MPNNNETTTKFKVDISELKKNFQEASRQIRLANSEFKAATSGMDKWTDSAEGISAKLGQLNKTLDAQKTQLKSLEKQYELVVKEQGEGSKGAEELKIKINNQKAAIGNTEKQIRTYNSKLDEMESASKDVDKASDNLESSLDDVSDSAKEAGEGFTVFKGVLANLVASGIKAAIQGFKDLAAAAKEAYHEFDEGYDNVIKATGATGETAKNLEKSYKNVAKSVKGEFGDIGKALGEVNTRFGFTDKKLEDATVAFMKFADITGTDATNAVQLVSRAMGDAGIDSSEYATVLDELAIAAQASGISVDKLAENLTKYGAPMRALGFDTKESIAIFSQWEKAGVNTEIAFSGMKTAISNWSKEGKDAKKEFKKTLDEIASAPNIAKATEKAIEVFGKKAGPDLADAIKEGRFEYSDFLDLLEGSEGTVNKTYEQTQDGFDKISLMIQGLKADAGEFIKEILDKYGPDIEDGIKKISSTLKKFVNWAIKNLPKIEATLAGIAAALVAFKVITVIAKAVVIFQKFFAVIKAGQGIMAAFNVIMAANPIALIVAAIAGLVAAFVVLWNKSEAFRNFWIGLWEKIKAVVIPFFQSLVKWFSDLWVKIQPIVTAIGEFLMEAIKKIVELIGAAWGAIKAVWDKVKPYFKAIWEGIKKVFSVVKPILLGFFKGAWTAIKTVWGVATKYFKMIWNNIKTIFSAVKNTLGAYFKAAWTVIKAIWDTVTGYFKMIWNNIKAIFSVVKSVLSGDFKGAWEGIKKIWDNVKGYFQSVWNSIKSVFSAVGNFFKTAFSNAWTAIKGVFKNVGTFFSGVWSKISSPFVNIAKWFKSKFTAAWKAIKGVFSSVGSFFGGIWDTIKEKFTTIGTKVADAIGGAFKSAINAVIATVEGAINLVPKAINGAIDLINKLPGVEISEMPEIELPRLAKGGVLKKGQVGLLEGSGAEAVVPLEKNNQWLDEIARRLSKRLDLPRNPDSVGSRSSNVVNNFYQTNNSPKALSRLEIYRQSKNLLRMKG